MDHHWQTIPPAAVLWFRKKKVILFLSPFGNSIKFFHYVTSHSLCGSPCLHTACSLTQAYSWDRLVLLWNTWDELPLFSHLNRFVSFSSAGEICGSFALEPREFWQSCALNAQRCQSCLKILFSPFSLVFHHWLCDYCMILNKAWYRPEKHTMTHAYKHTLPSGVWFTGFRRYSLLPSRNLAIYPWNRGNADPAVRGGLLFKNRNWLE